MKFTGRRRYRRGLFGRLILQVEITTEHVSHEPMTCDVETYTHTQWRDAKITDLTVVECGHE